MWTPSRRIAIPGRRRALVRTAPTVLAALVALAGPAAHATAQQARPTSPPAGIDTAAAPDSAAPLLRPGAAAVDGRRLRPDSARLRMVVRQHGRDTQIGTMTERLMRTTVDGRAAYLRVQTITSPITGTTAVDSVYVARGTLAPIRRVSRDPGKRSAYVFTPRHVVGETTGANGRTLPMQRDFSQPLFDANPLDLVIRALPLRKGYAARLPAWEPAMGGPIEVGIRVLGRDTASDGAGHEVPAWVVRVSHGGMAGRYWIAVKGRALLKQTAPAAPGMQMWWVR